jgi:N utilization substance protein A
MLSRADVGFVAERAGVRIASGPAARSAGEGGDAPTFFVANGDLEPDDLFPAVRLRRMMNPSELLRLVDSLHREKDIDSESVFKGIESALLSAARKHLGASDNLVVTIDRQTGEITANDGDREIDPSDLGRIAAQTAKQVMIQKIREAERDAISHDFSDRVHTVVGGTVQRFEGPNIVVNLSKTEGFLPRSEQIFSETYHVGERLRALVLEVRAVGTRVRVVLSRSHPEFVRRLFELEVPEVGEGLVEIKGIAREAGYRTKIAVNSLDPRVDSVGACVGVQGSRIKSIVDELNGEKIDIVRWSDQMDGLIANTLKPAEIESISLNADRRHALVIVPEDQLSLAIGKRGQNVRLAAKLTGWDIDIKPSAAPKAEAPAAAEQPKAETAAPPEAAEEPKAETAAPPEAAEEPKEQIAAPPEAVEAPPAPASEAPSEPSNAAPNAPAEPPAAD